MRTATDNRKALLRAKSPLTEKRERVTVLEPDEPDIDKLYAAFRKGRPELVAPNGDSRVLPESLHSFLVELIGLLNEGKSLIIVQNQANLTTIEAASLIGVSRQFLVNLLEKGEIPYHMVGTHRRIYAQDLFSYRAKRDGYRRKTIRELAKAEAKDGLYGRTPTNED